MRTGLTIVKLDQRNTSLKLTTKYLPPHFKKKSIDGVRGGTCAKDMTMEKYFCSGDFFAPWNLVNVMTHVRPNANRFPEL